VYAASLCIGSVGDAGCLLTIHGSRPLRNVLGICVARMYTAQSDMRHYMGCTNASGSLWCLTARGVEWAHAVSGVPEVRLRGAGSVAREGML
jgi:hypothetical protein